MTKKRRHRPDPDRGDRRAKRREELLDAAAGVVRREGPGASMDDLAAGAGVTKPILYRHFGDRAGLVGALAERFAAEITDETRRALRIDAEPRSLLEATIDTYLRRVEEHPEIYRFLTQEALPAHPEEVTGVLRRIGQEVAVVLGEALRAAGLDSGPAEPWGYGMVGMVHLAGHWWLDARSMPRERLVAYLTELLWTGLAGAGLEALTVPEADAHGPIPIQRKRRTR